MRITAAASATSSKAVNPTGFEVNTLYTPGLTTHPARKFCMNIFGCRFVHAMPLSQKYASLLFRLVATSFPTCPVTPNTSRLLELFILISFVLVFSLPSNLDTARPLLKESSSSMNNAYMNQLSQKKISLDGV